MQDLSYFYDPVGNVTRIRDDADIQNVVFFQNQRVEPSNDYTYDPLYRLISASGREHLGQTNGALNAAAQIADDNSFRIRLPQPGDGNAMGTYVETYAYDPLGNIVSMAHQVASGGWTRRYTYTEPSQIVTGETGNRLTSTSMPGDSSEGPFSATYAYDAHGNMTRAPHLPAMTWGEDDQLRSTTRQVVNTGTPPTTYYAYDSGGERIRKVLENQAGIISTERIYLGDVEVYREFELRWRNPRARARDIPLPGWRNHCGSSGVAGHGRRPWSLATVAFSKWKRAWVDHARTRRPSGRPFL